MINCSSKSKQFFNVPYLFSYLSIRNHFRQVIQLLLERAKNSVKFFNPIFHPLNLKNVSFSEIFLKQGLLIYGKEKLICKTTNICQLKINEKSEKRLVITRNPKLSNKKSKIYFSNFFTRERILSRLLFHIPLSRVDNCHSQLHFEIFELEMRPILTHP